MEQFFLIAAAHFLALLLPGPDFFLIARTSLSSGWLVASGAGTGWKVFYGTWMFGMVLLWDLAVALTVGNQAVLLCFERSLPWLERGRKPC